MAEENQKPKIVSDSDWKEEAQATKAKLSQAEQEAQAKEGGAAGGALPAASFVTLVNSLMVQILFSMGRLADPNNPEQKQPANLDLAKHQIDTLGVLEEKTKGNLTEDEQKALSMALHEMRMQYVAAVQGGG